jgi:hypothetical protein
LGSGYEIFFFPGFTSFATQNGREAKILAFVGKFLLAQFGAFAVCLEPFPINRRSGLSA